MAAPVWKDELEKFVINQQSSGIARVTSARLENIVSEFAPNPLTLLIVGIQDGSLPLLELIELLGVYLVDPDKEKRARGTQLLSEVLHRLQPGHLSEKEVELLVNFYCDRLKDHHSVTPPVLYGLNALSTFKNIPNGCTQQVIEQIFKEVEVQSMAQSDRRNIYQLLSNFLANKLDELTKMGSSFVYGYIQAMDGEKDPRNLVINFESVVQIIRHFPIQNFAEELFEVTSCYFPIDFSPPPSDPFGVKKETLVLGLRRCMSATPLFAEYCLPLILEKLSSDVPNSKLEALYTLTAACETYGAHRLIEYQGSFLQQMRNEVFSADTETMERAALEALTAYTKAFVNDSTASGSQESLNEFINNVFKECRHHLCEPELKLVFPSGKMMQAVAEASSLATTSVLRLVMPVLLEQFYKHAVVNHRRNILDILLGFIRICKDISKSSDMTEPNPIASYKDDIKAILVPMTTDTNYQLRLAGISGLVGLLAVRNLMSTNEVKQASDGLYELAFNDTDSTVRKESVIGLAFMSMEYPDVIKSNILPKVERQMEMVAMDTNNVVKNTNSKMAALNLMSAVSVRNDITKITLPKFIKFLQEMNEDASTCDSLEYTTMTLNCLRAIVKENIRNDPDCQLFYEQVLPDLLNLCVKCALEKTDRPIVNVEPLEITCDIIRTIVCSLESSQAEILVTTTLKLFLDGDPSVVGVTSNEHFKPLLPTSAPQQTQLICILMSIVCAVKKETVIPQLSDLLHVLYDICLSCDDEMSILSAKKCIGGLVNKHKQGEQLDEIINKFQEDLSTAVANKSERAFNLWLWLTKAFVLRGHPTAQLFISKIMSCLEDDILGSIAADGFYIVLNEFPDVMNPTVHAEIKMMYRQRFFIETLPKLVEGFNSSVPEKKPNYLNALAYLLRFVPRQVLLSELPPLLPLMIQSLHCEDANLWLSTLNTIHDLIHDAPEVLGSYVDSLVPLLLSLSKYEKDLKVRLASLQCLGIMTTLPTHKLVPHQKVVTKGLAKVLDDKKRLVRKEAGLARSEWFLLGK